MPLTRLGIKCAESFDELNVSIAYLHGQIMYGTTLT